MSRPAGGAATWAGAMLADGGALDPEGPAAAEAADLFWLMLALSGVVLAVFAVMLTLGLRRRRQPAEPDPGGGRHAFSRWFVIGGVVGPLIILVVVFAATVDAMRDVPADAPRDALTVQIVGHQFWWEVRYPAQRITARNELHIPVGRPVALKLTSADVVHSFWAPALGGKMDLLPDYTNTLVLQADEPGVHRTRCAEFCGLNHADMRLTVVAEPEERFAAWVAERR